ncbi:sigma-70 family RNA polymerase sigma factor [Actinokineospora sp. NBRC 105648]|uniref:RNA polymerase sigma factor n=1 Tax=Actinokineospora sp. NBRC 105648 TaxID=3032206 RepID=UPI0024A59475|nr:sigma-70 family RNA polymerase sigma factor [Actinokineospora sp. NBRC 105648]GLZ38276.1 RNA polymerase sigma factor [Actinokineospora sp. NBRC 105648]
MVDEPTTDLLARAVDGDQRAWRALVERYAGVVWRVARAHRLSEADAADVSQNTWVALAEHAATLHSPQRLAAWLTTTARRECLRVLNRREVPVEPGWVDAPWADEWPEAIALRGFRDDLLWRAYNTLNERCRRLLGLMAYAPELSYAQLGRAIGLGTSSVGTARGRCLHALRKQLAVLGMPDEAAG